MLESTTAQNNLIFDATLGPSCSVGFLLSEIKFSIPHKSKPLPGFFENFQSLELAFLEGFSQLVSAVNNSRIEVSNNLECHLLLDPVNDDLFAIFKNKIKNTNHIPNDNKHLEEFVVEKFRPIQKLQHSRKKPSLG